MRYILQDHLSGAQAGTTMKYLPYGETRSGSVPTDRKFTGQRLDGTGLYYYGARYYDPTIGRFISADTIVPNPTNPQALNRYTYCLNNPLKYVDPSGHLSGSTTIDGITYDIVDDGNGNQHLVGPDGSESGTMDLSDLLDSIAGEMDLRGDYGYGGDVDVGPVVTIDVQTNLMGDPIPVHFVSESWFSSRKGESYRAIISGKSLPATIMCVEGRNDGIARVGISLDFSGGAFVRYQVYNDLGLTPEWVSSTLETLVRHESFHYYEQIGSHGGVDWYLSYWLNRYFRERTEYRADYYAEYYKLWDYFKYY